MWHIKITVVKKRKRANCDKKNKKPHCFWTNNIHIFIVFLVFQYLGWPAEELSQCLQG